MVSSWQLSETLNTSDPLGETWLSVSTPRHYRATAFNADGESTPSANQPVLIVDPPGVPTSLVATRQAGDPGLVDVSWDAADANHTAFVLEIGDNGSYNFTPEPQIDTTAASHSMTVNIDRYIYSTVRVKAVGAGGESAYVESAEIPAVFPTPAVPTVNSVTRSGDNLSVAINVDPLGASQSDAPGFAYRFQVHCNQVGNDVIELKSPADAVSEGNGTLTFTLTGLSRCLDYEVSVGSKNDGSNGALSTAQSIPSSDTTPETISNFTASFVGIDNNDIRLDYDVSRNMLVQTRLRFDSGDWFDGPATTDWLSSAVDVDAWLAILDVPANELFFDGGQHQVHVQIKPVNADDAAYVDPTNPLPLFTTEDRIHEMSGAPTDVALSVKNIKGVTGAIEDNEFTVSWGSFGFGLTE